MKLLLAGDSWGIGVFAGQGDSYGPIGQGIHTLLADQGHTVTNISRAGGSNWLMIDRLEDHWGNTGRCLFGFDSERIALDLSTYDYIIFIQTDIFRERHYYGKQHPEDTLTQWKVLEQSFVENLLHYSSVQDIIDRYFKDFYSELNTIGQRYNKKVIMIGGWSQLHPSIVHYSQLISAIPSATKLLIPELTCDCYLSDPEWYTQLASDARFINRFGSEFKQMTIENAEKLKLVYKHWNEVHPGLDGYKILVEKIQSYLL